MSLRTQQKEQRKQKILDAAAWCFAKNGFQKTTMDAIANQAGVGVATVYNYFKSKDGIVNGLLLPELEEIFAMGEQIIENPPNDPFLAVLALSNCYKKIRDGWRDRELLRAISLPGLSGQGGIVDRIIDWSDTRMQQQFRDILRVLQFRGHIPKGANIADMATIIFAVLNHGYLLYLTHDDLAVQTVFSDWERMLKTLFEPWKTAALSKGLTH